MIASLTISGVIGKPDPKLEKLLFGTGVGDWFSADDMRSFLNEPQTIEADEIEITIDSMGGDVVEGLEIYDLLRFQNKPVTTIGKRTDSIASVIFLAGDTRRSVKNSSRVIHNAWMQADGQTINAQIAEMLRREFDEADSQLMAVYMSVAPSNFYNEIKQLMNASTSLTDEQMQKFNFATEIIEGNVTPSNRVVAFNSKANQLATQNQSEMSEDVASKLEKVGSSLKSLLNFFKVTTKNMVVELADGAKVFVYSEDDELVGKPAVLADAEGNPTEQPAPAGDHALVDGRTIVVGEGGVVTEVKEAQAMYTEEEMNAKMQEQMTAMNEEKQALAAELEAKKAELETVKTNLQALAAEVEQIKNEIPGEKKEGKKVAASNVGEDGKPLKLSEILRLNAIAQFKEQNQ